MAEAKKIMVTCEYCVIYQETDSYCIGCGAPLPEPEPTPEPTPQPRSYIGDVPPNMNWGMCVNSTTTPVRVQYDPWYDPANWRNEHD